MIHFNSLSAVRKAEISGSVRDQGLKVDTGFDLTGVLVSAVLTEALPIWSLMDLLSLPLNPHPIQFTGT